MLRTIVEYIVPINYEAPFCRFVYCDKSSYSVKELHCTSPVQTLRFSVHFPQDSLSLSLIPTDFHLFLYNCNPHPNGGNASLHWHPTQGCLRLRNRERERSLYNKLQLKVSGRIVTYWSSRFLWDSVNFLQK